MCVVHWNCLSFKLTGNQDEGPSVEMLSASPKANPGVWGSIAPYMQFHCSSFWPARSIAIVLYVISRSFLPPEKEASCDQENCMCSSSQMISWEGREKCVIHVLVAFPACVAVVGLEERRSGRSEGEQQELLRTGEEGSSCGQAQGAGGGFCCHQEE